MATTGADGKVKVWDARMWGTTVREWQDRRSGVHEVGYSMKGMLAVGGRGGVTVYRDLHLPGKFSPTPYMSLDLPALTPRSVVFCPYEDVLGVGHSAGFSSLLVPGSGEAQFDSNEADVYESHNRRREREVRGVLEKIQPDLITLDADFLGRVADPKSQVHSDKAVPFYKMSRIERLRVTGQADENDDGAPASDEEMEDGADGAPKRSKGAIRREKLKQEKEKHKMRGKSKSMKRYLRKKRKNVIDPAMVAVKDKLAREKVKQEHEAKIQRGEVTVETGALSRFT